MSKSYTDETEKKPTKSQFMDYLCIRNSGVTNMYAIDVVCYYSKTELTYGICYYIMEHFDELTKEYNMR